jgi:ubiquinone/menaquinone biosynthesis C-methylase UbiE
MADRGVAGLIERALAMEIQVAYAVLALAALRASSRRAYKGVAMEGFIASWYAKITRSEATVQQEQARALADRVPVGGRVLEIAPGPGYLAIALSKCGRQEVFGIDISKTFVEIATRNARAAGVSVTFEHGNASELPYPDASFDFVICRAAFKNFSDPMGALNEIHRVLRPGGAASILDLRRESSPHEIRALVEGMRLSPLNSLWTKLTFRFFLLKNAYSRDAIEALAARSRFGVGEVVPNGVEFDLRLSKANAA